MSRAKRRRVIATLKRGTDSNLLEVHVGLPVAEKLQISREVAERVGRSVALALSRLVAPPRNEPTMPLQVRISPALRMRLNAYAKARGKPACDVVRDLIRSLPARP